MERIIFYLTRTLFSRLLAMTLLSASSSNRPVRRMLFLSAVGTASGNVVGLNVVFAGT
jgi:hypothetical protein